MCRQHRSKPKKEGSKKIMVHSPQKCSLDQESLWYSCIACSMHSIVAKGKISWLHIYICSNPWTVHMIVYKFPFSFSYPFDCAFPVHLAASFHNHMQDIRRISFEFFWYFFYKISDLRIVSFWMCEWWRVHDVHIGVCLSKSSLEN